LIFFNLLSCSIFQASLSVADICKTFGASWVTLERAFNEEFGIAPKVYIQSKGLTAVRQLLIKSEPGTLFADAANRWGFGTWVVSLRIIADTLANYHHKFFSPANHSFQP
jgi:AraC-like DNA-binding protein